ncbi:cellulase family glycosylhydrolase [Sphingomonas sp.]|uniref:glycoside hydrolase 5 family protein n=1 Tax=Sphingomonas sp. TaxID=28214 RepID=UPI0025CB9BC5|nr:cellulase family glycosylhydrolase [Sphingomonas sp.]MBV9528854.1 cellulase family glycosylhydrolase [Sphingomonas sp.]
MPTRRELIVGTSALLAASCVTAPSFGGPRFIRTAGMHLTRGGARYPVVGTNMWAAAYLGAEAPVGNRGRLERELDRLSGIGVDNVRILGSSEFSPLKNSVRPTFRDQSASYNESLLRGMDVALAEIGRRNMTAVIYLTNFWEWSGGMMTYLYWTNGGRYINMNDPAHPWPEFADMSSQFYQSAPSVAMYHDYVRAVVGRRNSVTGVLYRDDPAIMAWQLANEPRPGGSPQNGRAHMAAYLAWIDATARLIKSIDPNHLVCTGSEGTQGCIEDDTCVVDAHSSPAIDYMTAHIWPQNWSWADPNNLAGTWPTVETNTRAYFARQAAAATRLGKPLVIEEFGFPRDAGSYEPAATTAYKDRFYALIYELVAENMRAGGPAAGANFWGWGGEGRAQHPDHHFVRGDTSYLGDPPHEPQGWYSVFDADASTQAVIRNFANAARSVG